MARRELHVRPIGGLANRLRALATASTLAAESGRRLVLDWRPCSGLECPAHLLFAPGLFTLGRPPKNALQVRTMERGPVVAIPVHGPARVIFVTSCHPLAAAVSGQSSYSRAEMWERTRAAAGALRGITPAPSILNVVARYDVTGRVGVHVRRGESIVYARESPTAAFFRELDECDDGIFLATNSDQQETAFRDRYGDRVLVHPKASRGRCSPAGVRDAFVDLLLLARTRRVVGTFGSSFSQVAGAMCEGGLTVAKKEIMKRLDQGQKHALLRSYQKLFGLNTLVETGTWFGGTVADLLPVFKRIVSIELSDKLFARAREQFVGNRNVHIVHGDSGVLLGEVISRVRGPCLFWLDAHYAGEHTARGDKNNPIIEELRHIFDHGVADHVVLIDDAQLFNGRDGWPRLAEIKTLVAKARPRWVFNVVDDVIRAHPLLRDMPKGASSP